MYILDVKRYNLGGDLFFAVIGLRVTIHGGSGLTWFQVSEVQ
jgi:hypothetical protein